ncbi:hypothetical protein CQA66_00105 [Helicobacter aurati]|uniref:DNA gyrase subunit B n=1 Tax=Helicobacter aurati TaxID=137778 RepID=A0A3D8J815_9HELI|nr:hypothetical protein [Helicobacter aurati]RDU73637.1 hypothetical protein CQA66_00105 [Helicobacter aurati]
MTRYIANLFQLCFITASLLYPFILYFYTDLESIGLVMAVFWCINILRATDTQQRIIAACITLFFVAITILHAQFLTFLYPVFINLLLFITFLFSLKEEAIITRFARMRAANLSEKAILYTRKLTVLWCYFFFMNGCIAGILAFVTDKRFWTFYCGILSYILIGIFLLSEIIYRKYILQIKENGCEA